MKVKFLSFLTTFAVACSMQAQEAPQARDMNVVAIDIPAYAIKQAPITKAQGYVAKGYCGDNINYNIGFSKNEKLGAAIFIPREILGIYKNAEVAGLRIGLGAEAKDITVFLIEGTDLYGAHKLSTNFANTKGIGFHDIMFRVPYQIQDNFIVGYTSTGTNQLGMDGEKANENASFIQRDGEWGSIYKSAVQNNWGALSIQLLLTGENMPENEMSIGEILTKHAEQNKPFTLQGTVNNLTTKTPVENYEIKCTFDNGYSVSQTIEKHLEAGQTDTFNIAINPQAKFGSTLVTAEITKVNGAADSDATNNTTMKVVNIIEHGCFFPRMVVIEEGTSVYCGYCVRGIVVFESMKKRYPDTMIGIAIHTEQMGSDPMIADTYKDIPYYFQKDGLPNGVVNRKTQTLSGDPMEFEIFYDKEKGQLSDAGVVIRKVSEVENKKIHVDTEISFARNIDNANYKLAYVLMEHNVPGQQMNSYSGGGYGSMAGWENKPMLVDIQFNDVARGIWDLRGMDNSLPASIKKKTVYKHSFDIPVPATVESTNLEVVVMVMDANKKEEIIQAAKAGIGTVNSISTPAYTQNIEGWNFYADNRTVKVLGTEDATIEVYSLDGTQVRNENLSDGIYVVRATANGKTMTSKVIIR